MNNYKVVLIDGTIMSVDAYLFSIEHNFITFWTEAGCTEIVAAFNTSSILYVEKQKGREENNGQNNNIQM